MIYQVVATCENKIIGKNNQLPWHFSEDLQFFKQLTTFQTVIMGRKTYESIGKPLPNRENFVLTKSQSYQASGIQIFNEIQDAIHAVKTDKVFIIGGAHIYQQTLDYIDGIYMTYIHQTFEGDTFFPELPPCFIENSHQKLRDEPLIEVIYWQKSIL